MIFRKNTLFITKEKRIAHKMIPIQKKILFGAADRLKPGGILALECGLGHAEKLAEMRADAGFSDAEVFRDASRRAPTFCRFGIQ